MSIKKVGQAVMVAALLGGSLVSSYGCDQPKPKCSSGHGTFVAKYTYVSGDKKCMDLKGEKIGVQTYNSARPDNGQPDLDHATIAIQSESLGLLVNNASSAGVSDPDPSNHPFAIGPFITSEPVADFCQAPQLAFAVQNLPEIKEDKDNKVKAQKKTSIIYEWANVNVYVTSAAYGTQFTADLLISTDGKSCVYKVDAMYPYVDCSSPDPLDPTMMKTVPDSSLCNAEADPAHGHATGSGISPDFPVTCDPDLQACVLTKPIPALN
jgi:hypothetical protein